MLGKALRIFFGCHGRPDRSFFWKGKQFPLCARCTGELLGIVAGIFYGVFRGLLSNKIMIACLIPLIVDGSVQMFSRYESTNIRRLITGILFGLGLVSTAVKIHLFCFELALEFLRKILF